MDSLRPISEAILLAGPTAVGKSAVALLLAERVKGEIISVDSMQVYRGLEIGTAKPDAADRARVPHHLLDVAELSESFDAAKFAAQAHQVVIEIRSRGRTPVLCGGTGLYFRAYLDGLGDAPAADAALRSQLEQTPVEILLEELKSRDPAAYEKIDRKNPRRVVRAVEIIRITGKPVSAQRAEWSAQPSASARHFFCLNRPTDDLRERIDRRVDEMFQKGLVEETRGLLDKGLAKNKTAMQALGYRQVVEHLRGERSLPETIELVKTKTRHFARRQLTWFRKQPGIQWVEVAGDESAQSVADRILKLIGS